MAKVRRQRPLVLMISLALVTVAAIPIALVTALTFYQYVPRLEAQLAERQLAVAETLNVQVSGYFGKATRELSTINKLLDLSGDPRSSNPILDAFVVASDFYEAVYLTDAQGRVTAIGLPSLSRSLRPNHLGQDFSQRDFYRQARIDRLPVWSDSFLSPVTGRMTVAVAQVAGDGMLIGEIGMDPLPEFTRRLVQRSAMQILLLDRHDQLVAHSDDLYANQQYSLANLPLVRSARAGEKRQLQEFAFAGKELIGSASQIAGLDWLVIVAQTEHDTYSEIAAMWQRFQAMTIVAFVVALLTSFGLARLLSNSFNRYAHMAHAIGNGDYNAQAAPSSVREFNLMQDSLTRMALAIRSREQQMRQARDDLAELNETLEHRVDERTDELTRANEELVSTLDTLQRTQNDLQRAEKLASLGSMVAGVAHELNTPIGNALMAISTQDNDLTALRHEIDSGQVRRSALLSFIERNHTANLLSLRNLERASELITSFKQVVVDTRDLPRIRIEVDDLVKTVLGGLSGLLTEHLIRLELQLPPGLVIESYPAQLAQVLNHLVTNAAIHAFEDPDHDPVGRKIHIEATALPKGSVRLTVSDNGRGIPAEHLPRLFDPFFTTCLGRGGSGLGLYVVHNLVTDLLGGSIRASSTLGEGTRIDLMLPVSAAENCPGNPISTSTAPR